MWANMTCQGRGLADESQGGYFVWKICFWFCLEGLVSCFEVGIFALRHHPESGCVQSKYYIAQTCAVRYKQDACGLYYLQTNSILKSEFGNRRHVRWHHGSGSPPFMKQPCFLCGEQLGGNLRGFCGCFFLPGHFYRCAQCFWVVEKSHVKIHAIFHVGFHLRVRKSHASFHLRVRKIHAQIHVRGTTDLCEGQDEPGGSLGRPCPRGLKAQAISQSITGAVLQANSAKVDCGTDF